MNVKALKIKLEEEKQRLLKDIEQTSEVVSEDHVGYSTHQADNGTEVFEQTKNVAVREFLTSLLADVNLALAKMDKGAYGVCEICGKPIDPARLEVLPAARLCITDKQKQQRKSHENK